MNRRLTIGVSGAWEPGISDITERIRGLSLHAEIPGGVQTIEFDLADDYVDSYRWAYDHLGCKFYVFDNAVNPPVAEGQLFESGISHDGSHITIAGPWKAYCFSQAYNDAASWYAAGTTSAQIRDMLTAECPGVNTDQNNIDETGTNNFPWQPTQSKYPGDYIPDLAAMSDAAFAEWYFWLQSAPMTGTAPAEPIAWFKKATDVPGLYQCWLEDMPAGGLDLSPSLWELGNSIRVPFRDAAGVLRNTYALVDDDSIARYGLRERHDFDLGQAVRSAAQQYRHMLRDRYKDPQQSANFTVNTRVYDQWGGRWPLWRVIADFPVKFTVNDLIPDSTVLGHTLDYKRTFITLAADYDHDANSLTITPDTADSRADALLARFRGLQ